MGTVELPVVVGVDGSDAASDALDWAAELAGRRGLPLRVVHASLWERYEGYVAGTAADRPAERLHSEAVLATAAERAGRRVPALKVMTDLAADDAVTALLRAGQSAEALVVGSRGRGEFASLLLGSVGLGIAARAQCPVVVVRGRPENVHGGMNRVVVGIAERERPSEREPVPPSAAVAFALREARLRGGELEAVHAWRCAGPEDHGARENHRAHEDHTARENHGAREDHTARENHRAPQGHRARENHRAPQDHTARENHRAREDHARRAAELLDETLGGATAAGLPPVPVAHRPVEGSARKALLDASAHADLLVVGARRRQGHFGMQLGLVNHAVLHHAKCPVAVVPVS
ncbi:universal stress protein [Streptomyces violaceusniger]|uniref:Universal stress protein n=2 Tax=Streptomyces violaceusniger group TaxID=2839105 RepID=A0ABD5J7Q9_9ACTN|nr:universal stress protein [Streptomyces violaceusniger]KUL55728.1 universal stress protein [Streptomyces violaceusniger]MEE4584407.1 universal stress protein [Streptomyces sp. DSM 41602]